MDYKQKTTLQKQRTSFQMQQAYSMECIKERLARIQAQEEKEQRNDKCERSLTDTEPESGGRKQRKNWQLPNFLINKQNDSHSKDKFRYSKPVSRNSQFRNESQADLQKQKSAKFLGSQKKLSRKKGDNPGWSKFSFGSQKALEQKGLAKNNKNRSIQQENLSNSEDYSNFLQQLRRTHQGGRKRIDSISAINAKSSSNIKEPHAFMLSPRPIEKKFSFEEKSSFSMKNLNHYKSLNANFPQNSLLTKFQKESSPQPNLDSSKFDKIPTIDLNSSGKKLKFLKNLDLQATLNPQKNHDKNQQTPKKIFGHRISRNQQTKKTLNLKKYLKARCEEDRKENEIKLLNPFSTTERRETFLILKTMVKNQSTEIYLVKEKDTKFVYCLKKCSIMFTNETESSSKNQINATLLTSLIREAKIAKMIDHPNIMKTFCCLVDTQHIYHLMEYMEGSSLQQKIHEQFFSPTPLPTKKKTIEKVCQIKTVLLQLLNAVACLHQMGVIHRDIKPSNIFVSHEANIKLGDFGISIYQKPTDYFGTLDYASPEMILHEEYDMSVDMWAVGCVAYELFTGRPPFFNDDERITTANLVNCQYQLHKITDDKLRHLISNLLQKNPKNRFNCDEALSHSFFIEES